MYRKERDKKEIEDQIDFLATVERSLTDEIGYEDSDDITTARKDYADWLEKFLEESSVEELKATQIVVWDIFKKHNIDSGDYAIIDKSFVLNVNDIDELEDMADFEWDKMATFCRLIRRELQIRN